jgi:hypothetical protein
MVDKNTSDDSHDDYILEQRLHGKSSRALARELRCTVREIDAALDRALPIIDMAARMRYVAEDLLRLQTLLRVFVAKAVEQKDIQAGLLCVKILERKAALLGLDQPTKLDVVQITAAPAQSSVDRIFEAIQRVANGTVNGAGNGNGAGELTDQSESDPGPADTGEVH